LKNFTNFNNSNTKIQALTKEQVTAQHLTLQGFSSAMVLHGSTLQILARKTPRQNPNNIQLLDPK